MTAPPLDPFPSFRAVPKTGVIFVTTEARSRGFSADDPAWANLGQGAPETGPLEGGAERIDTIRVADDQHEYSPVVGLGPLRDAVAALYNARYRVGKASQYTRENVAISSGGRLALTRVVSTLGRANIGHFLPDYTAYEELLDSFGTFVPIPILLDPRRSYSFDAEELREEILGRGLSALLLSNPCNPTGKLIHGGDLEHWVRVCRETGTALILDEFYSHYTYVNGAGSVSAAAYVEDVDQDPVVLLDGLTKNWRYPGWRVSWTVGPKAVIEAVASAGSFLDGGCSHPMQAAALPLVEVEVADREAEAIRKTFGPKRQRMVDGLRDLGVSLTHAPGAGFYCWGDVSGLPEGLNSGMEFFQAALDEKVIVVPGQFFDINPGRRRPDRPSRFQRYVRFSFGPEMEVVERGLAGLGRVLEAAKR